MSLELTDENGLLSGALSRRRLLRMGVGLGLALPAITLLAACGGDDDDDDGDAGSGDPTATTAEDTGDEPSNTEEAEEDEGSDETPEATTGEGDQGEGEEASEGGSIRVSYANVVADTLNQHISNHTQSRMQAHHVLDCLTFVEPESGEVGPWLAESWEISDDGTQYDFMLKQEVTFHDGNTLDAEAVRANFEYTMQPDLRRGWRYGALGGESFGGAEVVDDYTVRLTFQEPNGSFLIFASDGGLGIDSPAALEEYGDDYGITALVGSGPYKFVELVLTSHLTLEKNPDYDWGPPAADHQGPAYIDSISFQEIAENATRAAALQSGDVDIAQLVASQTVEFESVDDVEIVLVPKPGTSRMFLMNAARAPLDDINVRRALAHAWDAETFINLPVLSGIGNPAVGPLPRNMVPGGDLSRLEQYAIDYDPDRANELLDEAGWVMGSDGVRTRDGEELVLDAVITEADIPQVEPFDGFINEVGARLNIRSGDFNFWIDTVTQEDFHVTLMSDSGFNAPGMIEEFFRSGAVYNSYGISDPAIDEAIDAAIQAADAEERWEQLLTAMELIVQEVPGVWGWEDMYVFGVNNRVQNAGFNEVGFVWLYDTSVTE